MYMCQSVTATCTCTHIVLLLGTHTHMHTHNTQSSVVIHTHRQGIQVTSYNADMQHVHANYMSACWKNPKHPKI